MSKKRPLPNDTAAVVNPETLKNCRNLGLILDKFQPWEKRKDEWSLSFHIKEYKKKTWTPKTESNEKAKGLWLKTTESDKNLCLLEDPLLLPDHLHIDITLLDAYRQRWLHLTSMHGANEAAELRFTLTTDSRLIVGLGSTSTLETGILLHRIHGFPFIPGSALKGVARTWALFALTEQLGVPLLSVEQYKAVYEHQSGYNSKATPFQQLMKLLDATLVMRDEHLHNRLMAIFKELQADPAIMSVNGLICSITFETFSEHPEVCRFQRIFGYPNTSGNVVFFDAIPCDVPRFAADIMNVHYPEYYSGKKLPADDQQPTPISFLTVDQGVDFCFAVASRRIAHNNKEEDALMARTWLQNALCDIGIGGKTVAGYGYFKWR